MTLLTLITASSVAFIGVICFIGPTSKKLINFYAKIFTSFIYEHSTDCLQPTYESYVLPFWCKPLTTGLEQFVDSLGARHAPQTPGTEMKKSELANYGCSCSYKLQLFVSWYHITESNMEPKVFGNFVKPVASSSVFNC